MEKDLVLVKAGIDVVMIFSRGDNLAMVIRVNKLRHIGSHSGGGGAGCGAEQLQLDGA